MCRPPIPIRGSAIWERQAVFMHTSQGTEGLAVPGSPAASRFKQQLPWWIHGFAGLLALGGATVSPKPALTIVLCAATCFLVGAYSVPSGAIRRLSRRVSRRGLHKRPARRSAEPTPVSAATVDPAVVLVSAGVLHDRPRTAETSLDSVFATAWESRTARLLHGEPATLRAAFARVAGLPRSPLELVVSGRRVAAFLGDECLGSWESPLALCLDIAGLELLATRYAEWDRLEMDARSEVVGSLRLFVETCPDCGGSVAVDVEPRETSHSLTRLAIRCQCCAATIQDLEFDADDDTDAKPLADTE